MAAKAGRILEEFAADLNKIEFAAGHTQGMDACYLDTDTVFTFMRQSREVLETAKLLLAQAKAGEKLIPNARTAEDAVRAWFELPEARRDEYHGKLRETLASLSDHGN